jgi:hypothetical protein
MKSSESIVTFQIALLMDISTMIKKVPHNREVPTEHRMLHGCMFFPANKRIQFCRIRGNSELVKRNKQTYYVICGQTGLYP